MCPDAQDRKEITLRYERLRAISAGTLETAVTPFLLLIALSYYHAGSTVKSVVATGFSGGLLLSPLVVSVITACGLRCSIGAAALHAVGGFCMLSAALFPVLPVFVGGSVLGLVCASSSIPLLTQIYQDNYPLKQRGAFFTKTIIIRIAVAAVFSELAGRALSDHLDRFQWLLMIFAGALFSSSYFLSKCPSRPLVRDAGTRWFRGIQILRSDALFRHTLICWMIIGTANLMILPLRIEYLANPRYGLVYPVATIAFFTGVLPNMARLATSRLWGKVFDKINFVLLRIILNSFYASSILIFFTSDTVLGFTAAAIIFGMAHAGGEIAWSLWVTKLAPPDRVADYMSVHTFLTGVRGVTAPFVGFYLAGFLAIQNLAFISFGLTLVGTLMLMPEARLGRRRRHATPLVEEISE